MFETFYKLFWLILYHSMVITGDICMIFSQFSLQFISISESTAYLLLIAYFRFSITHDNIIQYKVIEGGNKRLPHIRLNSFPTFSIVIYKISIYFLAVIVYLCKYIYVIFYLIDGEKKIKFVFDYITE